MKRVFAIISVLFVTSLAASASTWDITSAGDSLATSIRVKQLQNIREKLKKTIEVEDSKRNIHDRSIVPEALEAMNIRQDSVCLALRSQLLSVELELGELMPDYSVETVTSLFNAYFKNESKRSKEETYSDGN